MIAISVLKDAQQQIFQRTGQRRKIRCFFSESDSRTFAQLEAAVAQFHKPAESFEIKTHCGKFEDAIDEIQSFIGSSFPLIFIDPTGWTGYPLDKIKSLFARRKCEVLINFMYDFVNRFATSSDEKTIESLEPILGGKGWQDRLDTSLERGEAVEKLFRETLKASGNFDFVVSTGIDKVTADRMHFFLAYGTKSGDGLKAFRDAEQAGLRDHHKNRGVAKEKKREDRTKTSDLFAGYQAEIHESSFDDIIKAQKEEASKVLLATIQTHGPMSFSSVVILLLQQFKLRETNIKDICVELSRSGKIENTWGAGNRKPREEDQIRIVKGAA